ncbi:MAG TPA: ATP-binding protein [Candidatus Eisenbacteria bacterium]|nr:ATP-binding protein [Candidatus Eisenbacteria bacterium]
MSAPARAASNVAGSTARPADPLGDALLEHFDRAPYGLFLIGADRKIVRVNDAMAQLAGATKVALVGASLRGFLSTDSPFDLEDRLFDEVASTGSWFGQLEVVTAIGDPVPMLVSITPVSEGAGAAAGTADTPDAAEVIRYVVTVVEQGEQRWLETESSRRAAELAAFASIAVATGSSGEPQEMLNAVARAVVEQLEVDACWIHRYDAEHSRVGLAGEATHIDSSLRLSPLMIPDAVNPALLRAIETREQVSESELLDRSIATVVHAPLLARDEVVGVISILSVEGEKLGARNSEIFRTVSYQVGTALQNLRLLESIRQQQSLLEQKNAQLLEYVEELIHADRLKNEFLANTSHELRTPLNSIIGFLNLVLDDLCQSEEEKKELLGLALRSGKHLLNLINDVLDLARIQAGRLQVDMQDVALGTLMEEVGSTLGVQSAEKKVDFVMEPFPRDLLVRADDARLRQILVNIIGNAIKFTSEGEVRVSLQTAPGSPYVCIVIRDTGIGVAPERRQLLFRQFSQGDASTTRKFGGTGLGLAIVKELVERMGGSVCLDSDGVGKGTTVTVTLTRAGAVAGEASPDGSQEGAAAP